MAKLIQDLNDSDDPAHLRLRLPFTEHLLRYDNTAHRILGASGLLYDSRVLWQILSSKDGGMIASDAFERRKNTAEAASAPGSILSQAIQ